MEGGSQQATSSDDGQYTIASKQRMREKEIQVMKKEIRVRKKEVRVMEKKLRVMKQEIQVKEEILSAQEKSLTRGNRSLENKTTVSKERSLCLKFLDEVPERNNNSETLMADSHSHPNNIYHFGSANMGQLYDPGLGVPNQSPSCLFSDMELENFGDYNSLRSLLSPERNNNSETLMAHSHSRRQSNACSIQLVGAAFLMLWIVRARRRVMALGGIHVQKRHRISCLFSDMELENFGDYYSLRSLLSPERNNNSETLLAHSHSRRQGNACSIKLVGAASLMLWMVRARRRVMALGGSHVQKRQRT